MHENQKYFSLEKWLLYFITISCWLAVITPLIVVSESYFPYIIQKTIIFRTLIELIFAAYLVLALFNPAYRPKKTIILWSVLFFFAVMLLTTFTSQCVHRSWWGNWERMFGTFNYLHYFLFFIVLSGTFKRVKDWNRILNITLFASLAISLYSISQRFGLGFTFQSGLERVNGTIGNASYLASYLLFHLFIALLFFIEKRGWFKVYYGSVFIINFFVLFLTGTRGAQLALFVCLPLALVFSFFLKMWRARPAKIALSALALMMAVIGLFFIFRNSQFIQNNFWLKRMTNYSFEDNTIQTRVRSWTYGLNGFRDNMIFGFGPENYNLAFNTYFTGDFYDYTGREIWFDRAHNTLVDMASMMGIFGLIAYLGMFLAAGFTFFNMRRTGNFSNAVYLVFVLLFFAYFFQNIFVFDSLSNLIPFYLLLAYCSFLGGKFLNQRHEKNVFSNARISIYITAPLALLGFIYLLMAVNIPEIKANQMVFKAYLSSHYGYYEETLTYYKKARGLTLNKIDLPILLSTAFSDSLGNPPDSLSNEERAANVKMAIDWMDQAISLDKNNMFLYYLQSKNYVTLASFSKDGRYLDLAVKYADKSWELSKENIRPVWLLAQIYHYGGQPQTALNYLDDAEKINSNLPETYYFRAIIYKDSNETDKLIEQYGKMIERNFSFQSADMINNALSYFEPIDDYKKIKYLYRQMIILNYSSSDFWDKAITAAIKHKDQEEEKYLLNDVKKHIPGFIYEPKNN